MPPLASLLWFHRIQGEFGKISLARQAIWKEKIITDYSFRRITVTSGWDCILILIFLEKPLTLKNKTKQRIIQLL